METIQIESVAEPFASHAELRLPALRLVLASQYLGLRPGNALRTLDLPLVDLVVSSIGRGGVSVAMIEAKSAGKSLAAGHAAEGQIEAYRRALEQALTALEASPRPDDEWAPVIETLGDELLATLIGVSPSSIKRYREGSRPTPQDVAERLHFLALLLAELAGSYNDYGMRRWFSRPRSALDNRRPADIMGADFDPDGPDRDALRALAEGLRSA
jgi:uncharacterized protein (DUF2384 family)